METPKSATNQDEAHDDLAIIPEDELENIIASLPKISLENDFQLVNYQGFWCPHMPKANVFKTIIAFQRHFRARDTDLIIASFPKTGTTWLKSLLFSIVNREKFPISQSPLRNNHPHELVCRLEVDVYGNAFDFPRPHHLKELESPRLFHTHLPYVSLPESIKNSKCKVVYIARNPMDTLVSYYHFSLSVTKKMKGDENCEGPSMEELFEKFYKGEVICGPFFEHVLEYWKESVARPDKVLFLKYEDLKDDPKRELKKLAEFAGLPFSAEEEGKGVIEEIIEFCSIGNLKEMEGNKSGVINKFFEKKSYFREGEVGKWKQHFTPSMIERMNTLMKEKFEGSGLSFNLGC